jgi:protein gp37
LATPGFVLGKATQMFDAEWSLHGGESVPQFPRRNREMIGHVPSSMRNRSTTESFYISGGSDNSRAIAAVTRTRVTGL